MMCKQASKSLAPTLSQRDTRQTYERFRWIDNNETLIIQAGCIAQSQAYRRVRSFDRAIQPTSQVEEPRPQNHPSSYSRPMRPSKVLSYLRSPVESRQMLQPAHRLAQKHRLVTTGSRGYLSPRKHCCGDMPFPCT
jgi:hypothetical protein